MNPEKKIRRLCYVTGQPAVSDGDSAYVSPYSFRLVYYPTAFFPEVTLAAPVAPPGTLQKGPSRDEVSRFENVRVRLLPVPKGRPLRWLLQWPVLRECIGKADLVCVNIPEESAFLAAVICKFKKKPLLVQVLGDWREAILAAGPSGLIRTVKSWIGEWMTRVTVRTARLVFAQGQTLFDKCASLNPGATRSAFVHSTVSDEAFFQRNSAGFHEPLRILTVCTLEPRKGLEVLARSLRSLLPRGLWFEWWCVGLGPSEQSLKELTGSLGISQYVKFFGYVRHGRDLFQLYRHADIFVLPSFHEGIPNAILEAMANCMPIVASDVGSIDQVITDGVEGVLIPSGEHELLAEAILRLAQDPVAAQDMGQAAYRKAQDYRVGAWSQEHHSLIEAVFGRIEANEQSHASPILIPS